MVNPKRKNERSMWVKMSFV